jgi:hypothetical protein
MRRRVGQSVVPIAVWSTVVAAALTLVASACGATTIPTTSPATCRTNADCRGGYSCLFSTFESCGAFGSCLVNPDGTACDNQTACACNGATTTVCLVNGNSPSPVVSLGSCDGATQQGYDATATTMLDAPVVDTSAPIADASEASTVSVPDSAPIVDANPPVDSADATAPPTLGTPCSSSTQCTGTPYTTCKDPSGSGTKICTTTCGSDTDCQPPANGTCDFFGYCELQ